jgi:hypothetical protein
MEFLLSDRVDLRRGQLRFHDAGIGFTIPFGEPSPGMSPHEYAVTKRHGRA